MTTKEIYFTNNFSKSIWESNYKLKNENDILDSWDRVANAIGLNENEKVRQDFKNLLMNFKFVPGGRIMSNAGAGHKATSLINCFVGDKPTVDLDSLEGIISILRYQMLTLKSEGGWGLNFSFIRPRGSYINGVDVRTPGAVKYMELFDKSSEIITEGPGEYTLAFEDFHENEKKKIRKGAMMMILDICHPDIEEFIVAKRNGNRLTKANLSVSVSNRFMDQLIKYNEVKAKNPEDKQLVELDKWNLWFPDIKSEHYKTEWDGNFEKWLSKGYEINVYKTISITALWDLIMKSTYNYNDPGIIFMDRANETFCANYIDELHIDACNPCGEQFLPKASCCNLGSLNLTKFISYKSGKPEFEFENFSQAISTAVRFLDDVIDNANLPLPEYKYSLENYRRIGLGIMGVGSALVMMNLKYGSQESYDFLNKVLTIYNLEGIKASMRLGKDRGSYKDCDINKHFENVLKVFGKFFNAEQLSDLQKTFNECKAFRHTALFSIQPTGQTGCLANNVSGGLEPIFDYSYYRTVICSVIPDSLKNKCPKFWEGDFNQNEYFKLVENKMWRISYLIYKDPETGKTYKIFKDRGLCEDVLINDYSVQFLNDNKIDVDKSVMVTAMQLSANDHLKILELFASHLDSSASKTINVDENISYDAFKNIYIDAFLTKSIKGVTTYRANTMAAVLNTTNNVKKNNGELKIVKTNVIKRPKTLKCNLHTINIKGVPYYAIVGLMGEDPYEIFIGLNEEDVYDENHEYFGKTVIFKSSLCDQEATLTKLAQGKYLFKCKDFEYMVIRKSETDDVAMITAFSRVMSCALRHGANIAYLVQQLEKTTGTFSCPSKVFARVLKKYIQDGTVVTGEKCPECGGKIIRKEGCKSCESCSWTACG